MTRKTWIKVKAASFGCVALAALTAGCTYPGDTSGFKPEKTPSKDEINRQIAEIKANPNMPERVKAMALQKLQKDLANAR